ncbi:hypothetical protein [Dechloromonas sp. A34]|uniref:hypothetical protein n=1 Tax=Dechloromonas sp. A34 TaxID=447588 RepID=UPI0022498434|nr:hypothetical protein [Dechloromonas sp. A34]
MEDMITAAPGIPDAYEYSDSATQWRYLANSPSKIVTPCNKPAVDQGATRSSHHPSQRVFQVGRDDDAPEVETVRILFFR